MRDAWLGTLYPPGPPWMVDADTLAIPFAVGQLPNRTCYVLDLDSCVQNLAGVPLGGDIDCMVRGLIGDVTFNGAVNNGDVGATKAKIGLSPALPGNARYDINTGGTINNETCQR